MSIVMVDMGEGLIGGGLESTISMQENLQGLHDKGAEFEDSNQFEKAIPFYRQVIQNLPTANGSWYNLIKCLTLLGRYGEAAEEARYALKHNPKDDLIYISIGFIFQSKGQLEKALGFYEKIKSPEKIFQGYREFFKKFCWNMASVYSVLGNYSKAEGYFRKYFSEN